MDGVKKQILIEFALENRIHTMESYYDKKTSYSNRAGSAVKVDYVFSDTEFVAHLEVYMWSDSDDEWKKMELNKV